MQLPTTNIEARRVLRKASNIILGRVRQRYEELNYGPVDFDQLDRALYQDVHSILLKYRVSDTQTFKSSIECLFPNTVPFDVYIRAFELITDRSLKTAIKQAINSYK